VKQDLRSGSAILRLFVATVLACATVTLLVNTKPAEAASFSNATGITTTLPGCGGPPAQATLYPSPIVVSGLTGTVSDVNVTLRGMNNFEGDFEIFLVGPGASPPAMVLLSDAGSVDVTNTTLILDDGAGAVLNQNGAWGTSPVTARPTDYLELPGPFNVVDTYPGAPATLNRPAPTGSSTLASTFNGISPNGTWGLYVLNDACDPPAETITNGWTLDIATVAGASTTTSVSPSVNPSTTGQAVDFTATVTSGGSPVTSGTVTFSEGATTLLAGAGVNASGVATYTNSTLSEGNHVITATYDGVTGFNTSNGSVNQIVDRPTTVSGTTFCNTGAIAVRPGNATPYPSRLTVSGLTGTVSAVTAQLKGVSHPFAEDIDALLVGPNSANNLLLASDAGAGATNNVSVNFSDGAAAAIPAAGAWGTTGTTVAARPTDYQPVGDVDTFPSAPPPASPAPATLNKPAPTGVATFGSAFGGSNPDGIWSLYVRDDGAPDTGTIAGGWCVTITVTQPPAITSANTTTFVVGTPGTFTVTATGTPTPALTLTSGTLPTGVSFNAGTGLLAGTPAPGTGGSYPLTFKAANGVLPDATQAFTLVVNQAPAITSANTTTFTVGSSGSFTVTATGSPLPSLTLTAGVLPSGVTFTSATGLLSGTPAAGTGGSYSLTFTAANGVAPNATQSFTLTVNQAPVLTSADTATFTVGSAGTFTVSATGFPTPTLALATGSLPAGVSFAPATGMLSGTPAPGTAGSYALSFTASNGVLPVAMQSFTLVVDQGPAITSANTTTFTAGTPGTFAVTATGAPAPTLALTGGSLPSGVTFTAATGVLAGTPVAGTGGSYPLTFTASNGVGTNATQSFTLVVNQAPAITSANITTFVVGTAGSFTVTVTGFPASTLALSGGTLPPGVTFAPATGLLTGTPAAGSGGIRTLVFTATNGVAPNATQTFTLVVNEAPAITSSNTTTFTLGVARSFTVTSTGYPAPGLAMTAGTLPTGVTFDPATGVLSGTPASGTVGNYPLTFTASNGVAPAATQSFTLVVNQSPVFTSAATTTFMVGAAGSFTVTASGTPVPILVQTGGVLPAGVTFSPATGVLSGTPAAGVGGTYPLQFTASNGVVPDATQSFTLVVNQGPAFTSPATATFTVGVAGSFTVTGSGFPAPTFTLTSGSLPAGVTFTAASGVLGGTPAAGSAGSYPVAFTALNGVAPNATQAFTLVVNQRPALTSANTTTFTVGAVGSFTVTATGTPTPTLALTGGSLPAGVTFTPATGALGGTPAAGTGGARTLQFTASNGVAPDATQTFTLVVNQAPAITSPLTTTFSVGVAGSFTVTASGFPAPVLALTGGVLPAGLTFTPATGLVSGTPAPGTGGSFALAFTAANGVSPASTQSFTLVVGQSPAITSAGTVMFVVGTAGSFTPTATGFPPPVVSVTGALPSGVTLNAVTGVLSGVPASGTAGTYPLTITASNGVIPNFVQPFTLVVNQAPAITSAPTAGFGVGVPGTFTVTATGSPMPTLTAIGTLPSGVSFNPATGVLSGTPAAGTGGSYVVALTAANGVLPDAIQFFTLVVDQPQGYRLLARDGGVFVYGSASFQGSLGGIPWSHPVVGSAATPSGRGYWLVDSGGDVVPFGDAAFHGSAVTFKLNEAIVGMAATPSGAGYWLLGEDGGVFAFGDAAFFGSTGGMRLQRPVLGIAATPSGGGYWLVASDGGVFSFGDAAFFGSTGGLRLNRPVVGMAATPSGRGYWLVASDGGVFSFGDAAFFGSTGGLRLNRPVVAMVASPTGRGYWMMADDGGVFAFGDAPFLGSAAGKPLRSPIVGASR